MCINQKEITLRDGRKHYVKCGKCPACQQERAIYNRSLINDTKKYGYVTLFITLTYSNRFIPYVSASDVIDDCGFIPVRRDYHLRRVRGVGKQYYTKVYKDKFSVIDYVQLSSDSLDELCCGLPFIRHNSGFVDDKVGILYKSDIQNFFKRLRINYERNNKRSLDLLFFCVGEYGPKTKRPHYHALLTIPQSEIEAVSAAILQSWKYCDTKRLQKYIEVAKNASSYVSSYVNTYTSLSDFYREKEIRPFSTHSKYYGINNPAYSLPFIVDKINKRDLYYDVQKNQGQSIVDVSTLLPYRIIDFWFPKIQGFQRLSSNELIEVYQEPRLLAKYARRLGYEYPQRNDIIVDVDGFKKKIGSETIPAIVRHSGGFGGFNIFKSFDLEQETKNFHISPLYLNIRRLYKARQRYVDIMSDYYCLPDDYPTLENLWSEFAYNVVRVWTNFHSELIKSSHQDCDEIEVYNNCYVIFDNVSIRKYFDEDVLKQYETLDVNQFKRNIISTNNLNEMFFKYDKAKKINNKVYSSIDYQF